MLGHTTTIQVGFEAHRRLSAAQNVIGKVDVANTAGHFAAQGYAIFASHVIVTYHHILTGAADLAAIVVPTGFDHHRIVPGAEEIVLHNHIATGVHINPIVVREHAVHFQAAHNGVIGIDQVVDPEG